MALTDIFIKRPVLSVVVSLLILLIGLRAAMVLPIRQYPQPSTTVTQTTGHTTAVMYLGFSSEELSGSAISDYLTRVVQPVLSTVDGVASADILGGQTFAMRLWLDPMKMAGRNVSPADVAAAIAANNFQSAAGQTKGYLIVSNISTNTSLTDVNQLKKIIVKANVG